MLISITCICVAGVRGVIRTLLSLSWPDVSFKPMGLVPFMIGTSVMKDLNMSDTTVIYFRKHHHRCLTGSCIHLWLAWADVNNGANSNSTCTNFSQSCYKDSQYLLWTWWIKDNWASIWDYVLKVRLLICCPGQCYDGPWKKMFFPRYIEISLYSDRMGYLVYSIKRICEWESLKKFEILWCF